MPTTPPPAAAQSPVGPIPRTVWALGFVSMFMDVSSEMIHSLLPVFLVSALHADALAVGLIEGAAEAVALITRALSGILSDRLGRRKPLVLAGYAMGALTKPMFAMAGGIGMIFTARFLDRVGKGIRGAPRDALIADVVGSRIRGAAYGLRQSMDTVGAFLGPLLAVALMMISADDFRFVFWMAVPPGLLAVAIIVFAVREPARSASPADSRRLRWQDAKHLGKPYWLVVLFAGLFTLARFSEAFLLLRAQSVGVSDGMIPLVLVLMNVCYFLTAYPVGRLSDRIGRTGLMAYGLGALVAADLALCLATTPVGMAVGTALWGLHMGLTQGLLTAMVADAAAPHLRGTAFGVFSMLSGIALFAGCLIAGWLWVRIGAAATFLAGAGITAVAMAVYLRTVHRLRPATPVC